MRTEKVNFYSEGIKLAGVLYLLIGTIPIVLPAALAGIALFIEAFVGTEFIGAVLDRSDISAVDARET